MSTDPTSAYSISAGHSLRTNIGTGNRNSVEQLFLGGCSMIQMVEVHKDGVVGILVSFSDGTGAGYVVEGLLALRPEREKIMDVP